MDSKVFITAKNLYSPFNIYLDFWKRVVHHHRKGRILGIDRVRSEVLVGLRTKNLVWWVRKQVPDEFLRQADSDEVVYIYTDIIMWVQQRHPKFFDHAKTKFTTDADG